MSSLQIILLLIIAAITGIASVLDEGQTHRPLVACTLVGLVLGDIKNGNYSWRHTGADGARLDERRACHGT